MAACSGVTTCLSEGSTECNLTSETCPPCVYALTGGDYSCYSRDTSGECPFSGMYAECDKSSTTTNKSSSKSNSGETTPTPTTKTPAKATETPTEAPTDAPTAAPETSAPDATDNTNSQTPTEDDASTTKATTAPSTSTTSSDTDATQTSYTPSSASGAEHTLTSNTSSTSGSPKIVSLALIGGAVVLVVIVIAFVARRVMKKKKMAASQERTVSSGHNSAWSDRTLGSGTSGGNLYSTYSYKDEAEKGNGISMLSDSQASSAYSAERPTADFSNYGENSQYAQNSQYYADYSVSTGPELMAAGAVAGAGHHYASHSGPSSGGAGSNFVDVTASSTSMRQSELDSVRSGQQPLTVSQLMPTAIHEDEEEAYATRQRPGNQQYLGAQPTYNLYTANAVPPSSRKPQVFGASTASSMRSDYDIVDPLTMHDVEQRDTEMLAEENRYPKFSFESEASSADLYDGDSSEEESDDERVRHGEHMI
ncbi:uncharacterized protein PITG_05741 [Phytophthora infestans T30-4]|uniref:Uncharacterized protein n=2 Tax=Phytophthora infestans TaxID=4787 RepID=D0N5K5_PHYIT|nr:uncharacterized protein PITG_05741 [Phytophthora infestans T30-4]EEY70346.1 conserved hypothetical protein [Phytophthora infestans T30-4]KAF4044729.1 hypothetical protein GN244_ATG02956 [Phytophthora infestans]KAF4140096.1 hypothetical protein GN958_ATG10705 [Phytophthora infestans]|eukprot:XP_002998000.1 conserved hypothetical protein [Phytophthora infestans T30-4]